MNRNSVTDGTGTHNFTYDYASAGPWLASVVGGRRNCQIRVGDYLHSDDSGGS